MKETPAGRELRGKRPLRLLGLFVSQARGDRVGAQQRANRCLQTILMHPDLCRALKSCHVPSMFILRRVFFPQYNGSRTKVRTKYRKMSSTKLRLKENGLVARGCLETKNADVTFLSFVSQAFYFLCPLLICSHLPN